MHKSKYIPKIRRGTRRQHTPSDRLRLDPDARWKVRADYLRRSGQVPGLIRSVDNVENGPDSIIDPGK